MWKFPYKAEIAINAVLFFCNKAKETNLSLSFMQIAKLIFYADKFHLKKYGRPITGDTYIKMEHGPNPSAIYDYLKEVRARKDQRNSFFQVILEKSGHSNNPIPFVSPLRKADRKVFSESDLEILDMVFSRYGTKSAKELRDLSHKEKAWKNADIEMCYEDFLDAEDTAIKKYLQETQEDWARLDSALKTA